MNENNKTKNFTLRFSNTEYQSLQLNAAKKGMPVSKMIRARVDDLLI